MTTPHKQVEYCYSTDEELFNLTSMGDVVDSITNDNDTPIGATYYRGEIVELRHAECIDVDSFLEQCDERAYEEIGDIYDNCFQDVTEAEKMELGELITAWAKKNVNMRFWKVVNVQKLKLTAEDLE